MRWLYLKYPLLLLVFFTATASVVAEIALGWWAMALVVPGGFALGLMFGPDIARREVRIRDDYSR